MTYNKEIRDVRFVRTSFGVIYLRKEDIVAYLCDLAAGEEADVRDVSKKQQRTLVILVLPQEERKADGNWTWISK